jgi:hypothetical protein
MDHIHMGEPHWADMCRIIRQISLRIFLGGAASTPPQVSLVPVISSTRYLIGEVIGGGQPPAVVGVEFGAINPDTLSSNLMQLASLNVVPRKLMMESHLFCRWRYFPVDNL